MSSDVSIPTGLDLEQLVRLFGADVPSFDNTKKLGHAEHLTLLDRTQTEMAQEFEFMRQN